MRGEDPTTVFCQAVGKCVGGVEVSGLDKRVPEKESGGIKISI